MGCKLSRMVCKVITQKHRELAVMFVDVLYEMNSGLTFDEIRELISEELLKRGDYVAMDSFLLTFDNGRKVLKKNIKDE